MLRALLLLPHAAVRLLRDSDERAGLDARHHRRPDEEQRAARDAGVRHQPVSCRRAAAALRRARERRPVPHAGARARVGEPRGRPARTDDSALARRDDRAQSSLDGGQRRRDVPLRFLRSASQPVFESPGLSTRRAGLAAARGHPRERRAVRPAGDAGSGRQPPRGSGRQGWTREIVAATRQRRGSSRGEVRARSPNAS